MYVTQALIAKESLTKDGEETANVDIDQTVGADRDQRSIGNRDQSVDADRDQRSLGNQDQRSGSGTTSVSHKILAKSTSEDHYEVIDNISDMEEVNNSDMIRRKRTTNQNLDPEDGFDDSDKVTKLKLILSQIQTLSDNFQQTVNDISAEEQLTNRRKRATNQNGKHSQHQDSDDDCDDSVKIFCQISAEVKSTVLRHLSSRKLKSFMASLEKKTIHAEYKNETIKIPDPYSRKANLTVALQNELSSLDKTVYYVRDVTPPMLHLLELYQRQTGNKMKYVYMEAEQEIKIRDSLEVYETIKKFQQYQTDLIDVKNVSVSVRNTIREFIRTRESTFENILLEDLTGNEAINIHYPVNEQNRALEVKNLLLFQLGLVKPTGRRNRRFDDFTSLQETYIQTDKILDTHEVITEEESQYGDRFTSVSPGMPSRNTNDVSGDISSITSSYNNSNQRDSNYGNRPCDMVSSLLRGNATLMSEASSFSSKGAYSLPVSGQRLDVQTDKTKAKEELIKEAIYCTEKHLVIKVYNGNILKLDVDCIVNAANEQLFHGAGVAGAISRAAGREFDKESRDYIYGNGSLDVGQCISTGAGRLPYRHVLHAVGPQWAMYEDKADCEYDLMMTIYNTLRRAEVLKMKSLAFPSISSGVFGVPWNVCAEQYARGVERFEEDSQGVVQEVHFVDINPDILKEIQSVFSYVFKPLASNED